MTVLDKLLNGEYVNKKEYPIQENSKIRNVCKHCKNEYSDCKEKKRYLEALAEYQKENKRLIEQFKQDLFVEAGITDNPKAEDLWYFAWKYGHSQGLHEVYIVFYNILKLIKQ